VTGVLKRILQAYGVTRWNVFIWLTIGATLHQRSDIYDYLSDDKSVNGRGKGKVHPRIGHEGPEGV
jgi:hypothetical protein